MYGNYGSNILTTMKGGIEDKQKAVRQAVTKLKSFTQLKHRREYDNGINN